jgi:hypothetical protein
MSKGSNLHDFSTQQGREAACDAIASSNLSAALKAALIDALNTGRFPPRAKGRPTGPGWKRVKNSFRALSLRYAERGEKTAEIKKWAEADNRSPKTICDQLFRPNRERKK